MPKKYLQAGEHPINSLQIFFSVGTKGAVHQVTPSLVLSTSLPAARKCQAQVVSPSSCCSSSQHGEICVVSALTAGFLALRQFPIGAMQTRVRFPALQISGCRRPTFTYDFMASSFLLCPYNAKLPSLREEAAESYHLSSEPWTW